MLMERIATLIAGYGKQSIKFYSRTNKSLPYDYMGSAYVSEGSVELAIMALALGCASDCLAVTSRVVYKPNLALAK